jgi:putative endonuclease
MSYFVYFLASARYGTVYIGITNNLALRLEQHRRPRLGIRSEIPRAPSRACGTFQTPIEAITREKQLKKWKRDWKIRLIETDNLEWRDLSGLMI